VTTADYTVRDRMTQAGCPGNRRTGATMQAGQSDAGPAAVRCESLVRSFGERPVIDQLDLRIEAGSLYGLVGPNGAGKTTLFRLIAGLLEPDSGLIEVLGQRPGSPALRASLGYMTQSLALYTDLTAAENIRFFARLYGLAGEALRVAVAEVLALVELSGRSDSLVRELSGGMQRRVSLACAVVHKPRLLLLDEPTAGVDPQLRATFWDAFNTWAATGTTLIVATHHVEEARRCDRLGLFRAGRHIADGTPDALLEQTGTNDLESAFVSFAQSAETDAARRGTPRSGVTK